MNTDKHGFGFPLVWSGRLRRLLVMLPLALVLLAASPAPALTAAIAVTGSPARPTATTVLSPKAGTPPGRPVATPTTAPVPTGQARTPTATPTPGIVRAKIEIVWPHGGASVRDAELANITAYLLAGDGTDPATALDPPPCNWSPIVRLWAASNTQPAASVAVGQKRFISAGGRTFPAWDFNDIDVGAARDPANKLMFFVTVDGVRTLHNVWAHAADARTIFPQQDVPVAAVSRRPAAVDARIEIVWPHDQLPLAEATKANITTFLFVHGTQQALAPEVAWSPEVRLHWTLNNEVEGVAGSGLIGVPRSTTTAGGLRFRAWDFNDVDISATRDPVSKLFFWITVAGVPTYSNVWAHGMDARTIFPQPDILNSCR